MAAQNKHNFLLIVRRVTGEEMDDAACSSAPKACL